VSLLRCHVVSAGTPACGRIAGRVLPSAPRMQIPPLGHFLNRGPAMILSVLLIARIASRWLRLQRRCAQARASAALRRLHRAPALQTSDSNLATTLSVTSGVPACARSTRLAV
jgi:hypothetical protein